MMLHDLTKQKQQWNNAQQLEIYQFEATWNFCVKVPSWSESVIDFDAWCYSLSQVRHEIIVIKSAILDRSSCFVVRLVERKAPEIFIEWMQIKYITFIHNSFGWNRTPGQLKTVLDNWIERLVIRSWLN